MIFLVSSKKPMCLRSDNTWFVHSNSGSERVADTGKWGSRQIMFSREHFKPLVN